MLHSFQEGASDGALPWAGLIALNGTLYGTTTYGGSGSCDDGCGTVYSLDPKTGKEKVVYSFCGQNSCSDGAYPYASLIDVKGVLYSTTSSDGSSKNCYEGCGTIFSFDPVTGKEKVLYSFLGGTADGFMPNGLFYEKGVLYCTTSYGGIDANYGTVFEFDLRTTTEEVLYDFCSEENCADGWAPGGNLIAVKGALYGTAESGGDGVGGGGTVFKINR